MKVQKITASLIRSLILPRKNDSNKGDYGHVLVIAGSRNMPGAAVLCANGALRTGAGLVTAAVCKSTATVVLNKLRPEGMSYPLSENSKGTLSFKAAGEIKSFIKKRNITSLALGPGLGQSKDITRLVKKIISSINLPIVLDADGLNAIKAHDLKKAYAKLIVTPHPGEMSRLTGVKILEIQKRREHTAQEFTRQFGALCVLKGSGTVVTDGKKVFVNTTGNPGMAKGGSGDVLTGMIAALIGQVREPKLLNAALCGVFLHGLAGDIAVRKKTRIGVLPGDISETVPAAIRKIR